MDPAAAALAGALGGAVLSGAVVGLVTWRDRCARASEARRDRVEEAAAALTGAALSMHGLAPVAITARDLPAALQMFGGMNLSGRLLIGISGVMERAAVAHSILRTSAPSSVIVCADALLASMEATSQAIAIEKASAVDFDALTDLVADLRGAVRLHNGYEAVSPNGGPPPGRTGGTP